MTDRRTPPASTPALPLSLPFRVAALGSRKTTRFDLAPDAATRAAVALALGITAVPALRFKGEIRPCGRHDYELEAQLTATVEQPCSVTLVPVVSKLTETVRRRYLADLALPEGDEVEMPEDDSADPLPEVIDAGAVALEALVLALPLYPRSPGAALEEAVFAPPGTAPLRDKDLRPFAGLAGLRGLASGGTDEDDGNGGPGAAA
ncbi:YceD family protein [Paracoccaceae bacterium Fryx2]|nr:YceD family protein [Paracoccaceae bacterium Fryx2]